MFGISRAGLTAAIAVISIFATVLVSGATASTPKPGNIGHPHSAQSKAGISYELFPQTRRWPGNVVRYHVEYRAIKGLVARAARVWNRSGVKIKWRHVPASRAQVLVRNVEMATLAGWAGQLPRPGKKGRFRPGDRGGSVIKVDSSVLKLQRSPYLGERRPVNRVVATQIMVHEMGHILGLAHTTTCAVMNPALKIACGEPPAEDTYRCRPLEEDDLEGATRLLGGKGQGPSGQPWCRVSGVSKPVENFSVSFNPSDPALRGNPSVTARWTTPSQGRPEFLSITFGENGVCPIAPNLSDWYLFVPPPQSGRPTITRKRNTLPPGDYCASAFSLSAWSVMAATHLSSRFTIDP